MGNTMEQLGWKRGRLRSGREGEGNGWRRSFSIEMRLKNWLCPRNRERNKSGGCCGDLRVSGSVGGEGGGVASAEMGKAGRMGSLYLREL